MFNESGRDDLTTYTQVIQEWDDSKSRIVILNNGSLPQVTLGLDLVFYMAQTSCMHQKP